MPTLLGLDLGTTTITAVALDSDGKICRIATRPNSANITPYDDKRRGRSAWDAPVIVKLACDCLRDLDIPNAIALGVTGQQHGMLLLDQRAQPLSPLINWQDKRADEAMPGTSRSWVTEARERAGDGAVARTGCRLSAGYLAVTLFWFLNNSGLARGAKACFLMDYMTALLTGTEPVTDPTCAASAGVLDIARRDWDDASLAALGLSRGLLPRVVPSGTCVGGLTTEMAALTGLPAELPVFVGVGDNQASFLGSVAEREQSVLVNVGTGGQVAVWSAEAHIDRQVETRPFFDGYLLVVAGLSGGAAYATLERFFRDVGRDIFHVDHGCEAYDAMNRLAASVPAGADGLSCEPFFSGTRHEPWLRGSFTGLTLANFTPAHLARALLEGMARAFAISQGRLAQLCGRVPAKLIGAGNGIRTNPLLASIVADAFGLPMRVPAHREEAAYGAALLAGIGAGAIADLDAAGKLLAFSDLDRL